MVDRNWRTPTDYALQKLPRSVLDWNGELGRWTRAYAPQVFGDAPPEAFIGFASNGSQRERAPDTDGVTERDALGYFGTPLHTWRTLRTHPTVVRLLGRPAVDADTGAWQDAVADQVAVGLTDLRQKLSSVSAGLAPAIRPAPPGVATQWALALAFAGWSSGPARIAPQIQRYQALLASVPESMRWTVLLQSVAREGDAGTLPGGNIPNSYNNPGHAMQRTWQKLAAGELLAARLGRSIAWWNLGISDPEKARLEARITAIANASRAGSQPVSGGSITARQGRWLLPWVLIGTSVLVTASYLGATRTQAGKRIVVRAQHALRTRRRGRLASAAARA